jgi:hypothetical protein
LNQNIERLLDEQIGIQHDEAERQGQDIVASSDFEELADGFLDGGQRRCFMRNDMTNEMEVGYAENVGQDVQDLASVPCREDWAAWAPKQLTLRCA